MSIKKMLVELFMSAILAGCTTKLVKDPYPQAVESRYYNVEFSINDTQIQGGDVLLVDKTSSPSDFKLSVYGPDEGVIYLASKRCGVDKSISYTKGKHVTLNLGDLFTSFQNCMLEITVVPSYDEWKHDQVSVSPHQGILYVRVLPDNSDHVMKVEPGNFIQLKTDTKTVLTVKSHPDVDFAVFHCLSNKPRIIRVSNEGIVQLETYDMHLPGSGCLIQLKDKNGGFSAVMLNVYEMKYQPLAEPTVVQKDKKLHIKGEKYVTLTDVNGQAFHGNKATVKYTSGIVYRIRQYTTQGRSIVCDYEGKLNCKR